MEFNYQIHLLYEPKHQKQIILNQVLKDRLFSDFTLMNLGYDNRLKRIYVISNMGFAL